MKLSDYKGVSVKNSAKYNSLCKDAGMKWAKEVHKIEVNICDERKSEKLIGKNEIW